MFLVNLVCTMNNDTFQYLHRIGTHFNVAVIILHLPTMDRILYTFINPTNAPIFASRRINIHEVMTRKFVLDPSAKRSLFPTKL